MKSLKRVHLRMTVVYKSFPFSVYDSARTRWRFGRREIDFKLFQQDRYLIGAWTCYFMCLPGTLVYFLGQIARDEREDWPRITLLYDFVCLKYHFLINVACHALIIIALYAIECGTLKSQVCDQKLLNNNAGFVSKDY